MAQHMPPSDGKNRNDITKVEGHVSKRRVESVQEKASESSSQLSEEKRRFMMRFKYELEFHDISKVKKLLKDKAGDAPTISVNSRELLKKAVFLQNLKTSTWNSKEFEAHIMKYVEDGEYMDALGFIATNEQRIIESWVEDFLKRSEFYQAASLLRHYAKGKPSKAMDPKELDLNVKIDENIATIIDKQLGIPNSQFNPIHDRIWSAVHNGYYLQASKMCEELNLETYGGVRNKPNKPPKPVFATPLFEDKGSGVMKTDKVSRPPFEAENETTDTFVTPMKREISPAMQEQYDRELREVMSPYSLKEMAAIFGNIPNLISRFHHTVGEYIENTHAHNDDVIETIKEDFRSFVDNLFEKKLVVVQEKGMLSAEEELLGIIDDLGYLDLSLYCDKNDAQNQLYLLSKDEAAKNTRNGKRLFEVNLRDFSPNDIVFDNKNFKTVHPPEDEEITQVMTGPQIEEEQTLVSKQPPLLQRVWNTRVVQITSKKAHELRSAA